MRAYVLLSLILTTLSGSVGYQPPSQQKSLSRDEAFKVFAFALSTEAGRGKATPLGTPRMVTTEFSSVPSRLVDENTATFLDYTLHVSYSPGGQPFVMTFVSTTHCAPAWFAQDAHTVYEGRAVDCR